MRAALFHSHGGPDVITIGEVPTPSPGPGEVRVKVRAAALNHLDLFVRRGISSLKLPLPHVGGADAAGVVDAVGPEVADWQPGDEVVINPSLPCQRCPACRAGEQPLCSRYRILGEHTAGTFAEQVVVPADRLRAKPAHLDWVGAASVALVFQTAWRALISRAALRAGETLLVLGSGGGVATAALQVGRLAGARVLAVASSPERAELARQLGAEEVLERREGTWARAAWDATGRRGADVILDSVGESTWPDTIRTAAPGGRIVTCGATTGPEAPTDLRYVFWRQLAILGSTMASDAEYDAVMNQIDRGRLHPVVGKVLDLEEAGAAHRMLEAGEVAGKLVLKVSVGDQ
jgi:NADPH:quinone reductase-like Zn-dependent oxidoreductase